MSVKLIPWLLAAQQKQCPCLASELLECAEADKNCFKNTIIGDKTRAFGYETPKLNNMITMGNTSTATNQEGVKSYARQR
jgi:hypothetical protein